MAKFKKFFWIIPVFIFLLAIAGFVFAQRPLEVDYPEIGGIKPTVTTISLPQYVKYIFNISIALAGLIAFGVLVYAGFRYVTSAGNAAAAQDAKERIGGAILGILVLFGSYLILTTINPQLTFFDLPELQGINIPSVSSPPPEEGVLYYTEIPVGGLIADLLSKERMARIKNTAENTEKAIENVRNKAKTLRDATDACDCLAIAYSCSGNPSCSGSGTCTGRCLGDPCPTRSAIIQTKAELQKALKELDSWIKKLNIEIIGIKKVYQDLLDAENRIQGCSELPSPQGKKQEVMDYSDFWQYREFLEKEKLIKRTEADRPWNYVKENEATFYCVEQFYSAPASLSLVLPSLEGLPELQEKEPSLKGGKSFCGSEIPIGKTIDDAEDLARKIVNNLERIYNSSLTAFGSGNEMVNLTDGFKLGNCRPRCWIKCLSNKEGTCTGCFCWRQPCLGQEAGQKELPPKKPGDPPIRQGTSNPGRQSLMNGNFEAIKQSEQNAGIAIVKLKILIEESAASKQNMATLAERADETNEAVEELSASLNALQPRVSCDDETGECYAYFYLVSQDQQAIMKDRQTIIDKLNNIGPKIDSVLSLIINNSPEIKKIMELSDIKGVIADIAANIGTLMNKGIPLPTHSWPWYTIRVDVTLLQNNIDKYGQIINAAISPSFRELSENPEQIQPTEVLRELAESNSGLGACYNSAETQRNFYQGKKVLWRNLCSCSQVKLFAEGQVPLFDKESNPITDCYSGQGKADNYFCCSAEVGF